MTWLIVPLTVVATGLALAWVWWSRRPDATIGDVALRWEEGAEPGLGDIEWLVAAVEAVHDQYPDLGGRWDLRLLRPGHTRSRWLRQPLDGGRSAGTVRGLGWGRWEVVVLRGPEDGIEWEWPATALAHEIAQHLVPLARGEGDGREHSRYPDEERLRRAFPRT